MYGWSFLATDIEPDALRYAEANVARNGLQERISARLVSDPDQVLVGVIDEGQRCVCAALHPRWTLPRPAVPRIMPMSPLISTLTYECAAALAFSLTADMTL